MTRVFVVLASLLGATGVALGAFGAHALRTRVDQRLLEVWEVATRYQLLHALALLAVAWVVERAPQASACGWLWLVGVIIFSGSLYAMVLSGQRWLGAVTPFGGLAMIGGWLLLAWTAWRQL